MPGGGIARQRIDDRIRCQPVDTARPGAAPARATALLMQGVVVVTACTGGVPHGMTVSSLSLLSPFAATDPSPPMVAFAAQISGSMHDILCRATGFAISMLADDQKFTARFFASRQRPRGEDEFHRISHRSGEFSGAPLLLGAIGWLDCRTVSRIPLGSGHLLVIGEALQDISAGTRSSPLLYGDRRYHRRPEQPTPVHYDAGRG